MSELTVASVILASHQVRFSIGFTVFFCLFIRSFLYHKQLDLLFILSSLISGWRKVDVQRLCAKHGLVKVLCSFIDAVPWGDKPVVARNGFTYDIDSSMKLQLLKIVVNFADRKSEFKAMLLTPLELRQALNGVFESNPDKGVITKIIHLIMHNEGDSVITVWMCACIEAFLRGADPRFHWWITQSGLIEYLVNVLTKKSSQQLYDLVSETIKWESRQLLYLEHLLERIDHARFFGLQFINVFKYELLRISFMFWVHRFHS